MVDVFGLRHRLVKDYANYVRSFLNINDSRISGHVNNALAEGLLWPDPLIQLNPSFERGDTIEELANDGILHEECRRIFRLGKGETDGFGSTLHLHRHQSEATRVARTNESYVLCTGTGSGKSLAYIIPIVDSVLRAGPGRGLQAIVVYPMNALANSQHGELRKFLCNGYPDGQGPLTFERYTGQESKEEKDRILSSPPDILLTNYMMLELILTRPDERQFVQAAQGLRFLVLDELHTYRGRQGADLALLVRRARDRFSAPELQCVGTSATLATTGSHSDQQKAIASVASRIFGAPVKPDNVIGETLRRSTQEFSDADPDYISSLSRRVTDTNFEIPADFAAFQHDPLASWIESEFGLETSQADGCLVRATPKTIAGLSGAAAKLSNLTGVDRSRCIEAIQEMLLAGYNCRNPETDFPAFAFRLHQFISRGDTVYASLGNETDRHITLQAQQYVPGEDRKRALFPLAFCRECGQEYYVVRRVFATQHDPERFAQRELMDYVEDDSGEAGFLYRSTANPWPEEDAEEIVRRVPDDWCEERNGAPRLKRDVRKHLPKGVPLNALGYRDEAGDVYQYVPAPFRFCLNCRVAYGGRQKSDFPKLTDLSAGGRSSATTILSLATITGLRQGELPASAQKLLSFTDNRQDASLQAGHFNDFVEIGLLRGALYRAAEKAGADGIQHDELTQRVFEQLDLPLSEYAVDPEVRFNAKRDTDQALRDVLGYRLYHDLRRGWRITAPNLEQCGLLEINYFSLEEVCSAEDVWSQLHPALASASAETRWRIAKVVLDHIRQRLAIRVDYLEPQYQERLRQRSNQRLNPPWAIDDGERLISAPVLYPRSIRPNDYQGNVYLSARSLFGQHLRRPHTFPEHNKAIISLKETDTLIRQLLEALRVAGLVERVAEPEEDDDAPGYQLPAASFVWVAGDGSRPYRDPLRTTSEPETGMTLNEYFVEFYKGGAQHAVRIRAHEHTAQLQSEVRQKREQEFREARLPILYCSPTMELGVDIAELNVVNMRNVPPTPANYAQRSGRAGRSGQPALVFSYCTTGSSHDQYFFRRPKQMVSGAVSPPRIDLTNKDLLESHVRAIWLAETGQSLGSTLKDILDLQGDPPTMQLRDEVRNSVHNPRALAKAKERACNVLSSIEDELRLTDWYSDSWLDETLNRAAMDFDKACDRWRGLYRSAFEQSQRQQRVITDASQSSREKEHAKKLRREAETKLDLLTNSGDRYQSDFYSYRYFASEGFLPGYNFPRLPLSAYIPGQRARDEFVSRPRFLAITEFGPRSFIYHEGSRYIINKVELPVDGAEKISTDQAKLCSECGYLHAISDVSNPDLCQQCGKTLDTPLSDLFRLENVSTKRRDRINCDEEDRLRLGYEVRTGVRFAEYDNRVACRTAEVRYDGELLSTLRYGDRANLWRINLGWARRKNKQRYGFVLDLERGYWQRNAAVDADDKDDPMSSMTCRVIPYVEDHKNCLLFQPEPALSVKQFRSMEAALKKATQVEYQLEDMELAVEPLPDRDTPRMILLYEASEGGAGVLRQLVEERHAMASVSRRALALCHFDPESGADLSRAETAREDCEAACYDCLMSYSNQRDHELLDRKAIRDYLLALSQADVHTAPASVGRQEHFQKLVNLCESTLERAWLEFFNEHQLRLPSRAQWLIENCGTRPDFLYEDVQAAIYVDGPHHDYPERQERDKEQRDAMEDWGWTVIPFGHQENWRGIVERYPNIFGRIEQ